MLRYCEFAPAPDLSGVAERYWFLEGAAGGGAGPILPDGHPELVVHLGERPVAEGARQAECLFVGQMRTVTVVDMGGAVSAWGIRFHPHAGRLVTDGIEQSRLAGAIHEAEGLSGLREALGNASDARARVGITDQWLRRRVSGRMAPSRVAAAALDMLPRISVERVAGRLGCSRRHLERLFAAEVGLSPKAWARIARLQAALRTREAHPAWSWADVAAAAGYADQPHMALEFREIAGSAPTRLLPAVLSHSSKPADGASA